MTYRGRFAPSPTGPLHAGSLLTALGSYLDAKACNGQWLVRIEDVDYPRSQAGAEFEILRALEAYGLEWDETVIRQSERTSIYLEYLQHLVNASAAYPCTCTRAELQARNALHTYDRHCLKQGIHPQRDAAIRFLSFSNPGFYDRIQGECCLADADSSGDFIIYRRDKIVAYHLAVVIDDELQNINQIVRGSDLQWETSKHLQLQTALNFTHPTYAHLPLLTNSEGQKLSKQTQAAPIPTDSKGIRESLFLTLKKLGLKPEKDLQNNEIKDLLDWGVENWDIDQVPKSIPHQN